MSHVLNRFTVYTQDYRYECTECGFTDISRKYVEKHVLYRHSDVLQRKRTFEDFDAVPRISDEEKEKLESQEGSVNLLENIFQPILDHLGNGNLNYSAENQRIEQLFNEHQIANNNNTRNEFVYDVSMPSLNDFYAFLQKIHVSCKMKSSTKSMGLECLAQDARKSVLKMAYLDSLWQRFNPHEKIPRSQMILMILYLFVNLAHPKIVHGKALYSCDFLWSEPNSSKLFEILLSYKASRCVEMMRNACEAVKRRSRSEMSFFGDLKSSYLKTALLKIRDLYGIEHNYRASAAAIHWFASNDFEELFGLEPFKLEH
jgi:hypothetical protein